MMTIDELTNWYKLIGTHGREGDEIRRIDDVRCVQIDGNQDTVWVEFTKSILEG